jgi:pyruvate-formate lyase
MRFGRDTILNQRNQFEALMSTYFIKGGSQAMITVINRGDLEKAIAEPEKYKDVFVRVGGFSARFVDLPKDVQVELLSRTTY